MSSRTLFNYISFMKSSLNAPIEYCNKKQSYYYKEKGLIQHLVPVAELDKAVDDYLAKVVTNAPITLRATAAPANAALFYALSTTGGPTPIALVDAADSRSLAVGVDLATVELLALAVFAQNFIGGVDL